MAMPGLNPCEMTRMNSINSITINAPRIQDCTATAALATTESRNHGLSNNTESLDICMIRTLGLLQPRIALLILECRRIGSMATAPKSRRVFGQVFLGLDRTI